jgi:hypothetical protein
MHAVHEIFYLLVFLLPGGLPEVVHLGFGFWRGWVMQLGLSIGCFMSCRAGGAWVVAIVEGPVAGVHCPRVIFLLVKLALLGML